MVRVHPRRRGTSLSPHDAAGCAWSPPRILSPEPEQAGNATSHGLNVSTFPPGTLKSSHLPVPSITAIPASLLRAIEWAATKRLLLERTPAAAPS